ncbi:heterokaryon incompatibility protein-domain-containing protein [Fomes fomentarius]|nr:heterokaryon incompatibility protein-domain-containing protein [Fomes fomentarius]
MKAHELLVTHPQLLAKSFNQLLRFLPAMDSEVKTLVCDNCWRDVFSAESFKTIWEAGLRVSSDLSSISSNSSTSDGPQAGLTYTTPSWEEMQRSINFMCEWCDLLCEDILEYYQRATKTKREPPPEATFCVTVRFERRTPEAPLHLNISIEHSWSPSRLVYTTPTDNAGRYITERGVLDRLDSPEAYAFALQRIRDCQTNHPRCPPPSRATLPTRVIDCADPLHPRLFITHGAPPDYYVALSYVWGEDQPHRTTTARLPSYVEQIDTEYIPKTIRDAVKVTHTLGLRYLWVDAFCIIQDSPEDKATEIACIRAIFRHAYVTIVAANANKVSDGFLSRLLLYNTPSTLPFRCPDGAVGTMRVQGGEPAPREPVNTRAWCMEERVLSTRALWYCIHTLQFECQTAHMNVDGSRNMDDPLDGVPRLPDRVFTPDLPTLPHVSEEEAEKEVNRAWENILRLYSRRTLTKPRDRLVAFSGIAEYFHGYWSQSTYIAGLWEHQLPGCLLWYKTGGKDLSPRPAKYRAPTWSWAAVDGEISTQAVTHTGAVCIVQRCSAVPKRDTNPFGEVTAGELTLNVIIRRTVWDPVEGELYEMEGQPTGVPNEYRSEREEIGYVTADAVEEASKSKGEVYAAVVAQTTTTLLGIVLIPSETLGDATYRRVGWFTAPFCDRHTWLNTPHELVEVV